MSTDGYMNLQLANTEEYIDGSCTGSLGEVLVRCNNVLYIRCEIKVTFGRTFVKLILLLVYFRAAEDDNPDMDMGA